MWLSVGARGAGARQWELWFSMTAIDLYRSSECAVVPYLRPSKSTARSRDGGPSHVMDDQEEHLAIMLEPAVSRSTALDEAPHLGALRSGGRVVNGRLPARGRRNDTAAAVSYTHLTLPTILLV